MYEDKDDVLAPIDKLANRIELPPVKLKKKMKYTKMFDTLKHAKGTLSVVICVKGEIYETTIQNRAIAEHVTYSFWDLAVRTRNDIRDLDIKNDVESIRLSTSFFEITVFLGGELGKSDYMVYVAQTTANSLPEPKWRIQDVYVQEILPCDSHVQRIDPVYRFQKALDGKTEKEEMMEKAIKKLQEKTTAKKEKLQKATIINKKARAITKNEVLDLDGTMINDRKKIIKQLPQTIAKSKRWSVIPARDDKILKVRKHKELPKIGDISPEKAKLDEVLEKNRSTSQEEKRTKHKQLIPSSSSTLSRPRMDMEGQQFSFPEEITDTIGSEMASNKKTKDRQVSIYLNFD